METSTTTWKPKNFISFKKKNMHTLVFLLSRFVKKFAYAVHIDWCYHTIHEHSCRSQHISALTTCTLNFMFRQVCIIEH